MSYQNLALIGRARSGKDTVAARLVSEHGYTRIAFADPLKEMAIRIDPFVPNKWDEPERLSVIVDAYGWERAKDIYPEVRRLLQSIGQTVRDYDRDFWLRIALDKVISASGPVVVSDVRYPNEVEALWRAGFTTARITRPGTVQAGAPQAHESETALDRFLPEVLLHNGGSLADLYREVDALALTTP